MSRVDFPTSKASGAFEFRYESWTAEPQGDWKLAYFDLELPITQLRVEKMFQETVRNWARMQEHDGWMPTTKPFLRPVAYFCPDPGKLGYRRFYLAARFKREHPELLSLDTAAQVAAEQGDTGRQFHEFFEQMDGFKQGQPHLDDGAAVEVQAQENAGLPERARHDAEEIAKSDWKATHRIHGVRRRN